MRVELHPDAGAELRSAAFWYEQRRIGLGDEFIGEVATVIEKIGEVPDSFPKWPGIRAPIAAIRRAILERFPYAIAFERREHQVLVLAVGHAKRRPLYWLARSGQ